MTPMQWLGLAMILSVPIAGVAVAVRGIGWRDTLLLTLATVAAVAVVFAGLVLLSRDALF